jgi:cobalt-zinc-cadmium resistance protein CzcA
VQQPLACVIVGGMLLSPVCSLLVIPTLSRIFMPFVPGTSVGHETPPAPAADEAETALASEEDASG